MMKLKAIYKQTENGRWDAYIQGHNQISVEQAEDFETARVILRIITAEEIAYMTRTRQKWDIVEESILYHKPDEDLGAENVKTRRRF